MVSVVHEYTNHQTSVIAKRDQSSTTIITTAYDNYGISTTNNDKFKYT
jgi:hypothetical protein